MNTPYLFLHHFGLDNGSTLKEPTDRLSQDYELPQAIKRIENRMDKGFAEMSQQIEDLRKNNP